MVADEGTFTLQTVEETAVEFFAAEEISSLLYVLHEVAFTEFFLVEEFFVLKEDHFEQVEQNDLLGIIPAVDCYSQGVYEAPDD